MDACHMRWDNRSAEQWIEEAGRFEKMAERFDQHPQLRASFAALARDARARVVGGRVSADQSLENYDWSRLRRVDAKASGSSDLDYYRLRASSERAAAHEARDMRVRRVHLEMAERYQSLIRGKADAPGVPCLAS